MTEETTETELASVAEKKETQTWIAIISYRLRKNQLTGRSFLETRFGLEISFRHSSSAEDRSREKGTYLRSCVLINPRCRYRFPSRAEEGEILSFRGCLRKILRDAEDFQRGKGRNLAVDTRRIYAKRARSWSDADATPTIVTSQTRRDV